jgi:hypothetical protein
MWSMEYFVIYINDAHNNLYIFIGTKVKVIHIMALPWVGTNQVIARKGMSF